MAKRYERINKLGHRMGANSWSGGAVVEEVKRSLWGGTQGAFVYRVVKGTVVLDNGKAVLVKGDMWRRKNGLNLSEWVEEGKTPTRRKTKKDGTPLKKNIPIEKRCSKCENEEKLKADYLCHTCRFGYDGGK